ncbi:helix-turn-helix domain-containing protein [Isobaculum melis]|uniref:Helix-turn-helix n=1 Tax=Isobaculum melis TaxID=142588 RepID=A0A1H9PSA6_9LACT|nr:helix-turn-helix transcriptional regulator [Isobaculum melis]SER51104.1 Helix-turn-helix [Isobaculum melis]
MTSKNMNWLDIQKYELDLDLIREKRLALNYTHKEIAYYLGYKNPCSYYKYENGDYSFKANQLPILAQILNCELSALYKKSKE